MTSVLTQFRFKKEAPLLARAALRSIGASLNFSIVALVTSYLKSQRFGQALPEADEHFGQTIDARNELDGNIEGNEVERSMREAQGFALLLKPLDLAARLKIIRDSCAAELDANAGLRLNPLTQKPMKNPYDLVSPLLETVDYVLKQDVRIDEAVVRNTALVLGMDETSIRLHLEKQHQTQQKFLKDNIGEIATIIDSLSFKGEDGHVFGIDDDETVEERLPAINRARLFVSADKGLWNARNREVGAFIRGNPNALGNIGLIDGERELLTAKFNKLMSDSLIKAEIDDAVERGARRPQLLALFKPVVQPQLQKAA